MIDFRKSVDVPMMNIKTQEVEFIVQVYGMSAEDLQTVPNAVVSKLAERYPGFTSSPFMLIDRTRRPAPRYKSFLLGKVRDEPHVEADDGDS